ncbi:ATP-binding cassette subfamily B multidrug efflux pump [Sinorhizobium kostiense]|uniref:ATP-binding cassette subfamily B multidrug efflux pump n=1 Tax=Sinorhizobium kostiense TaxID=76747 RepID=A0ABS4R0Z3_9HYPH|nr:MULTISPECIES: ABC transporter ATP-binding protein [Sinorhizobium]MBP2236568.1 ATP-binding cassette subfamily B multidrug efflux pump [Sinorhizobium kostiense]
MLDRVFKKFENLISIREHDLYLPVDAGAFQVLLRFLRPFRWTIAASVASGMLLTTFDLARLWAIAHLVDVVTYSGDLRLSAETLLTFALLVLAYALLDPAVWFVNYALRMQALKSQTKASSLWQSHRAAGRHEMMYFNSVHAGQVAGRIAQVSTAVQSGAELLAGRFPIGLIRFIGSAALILYLAPIFVVPVLAWIALNGVFAVWLAPKVNSQARKISETASIVNGSITEFFSNIRAIKTSFAHEEENALVLGAIERQNSNSLRINRLTTFTGLSIRLLNTGLMAAVLLLGLYGLNAQSVTPGEFVAAVTLAGGMAADAGWFVSIWEGLTQTLGTIGDARSTISAGSQTSAPCGSDAPIAKVPLIKFDQVGFGYDPARAILRNVTLEIQPGERVGIVGPSGAGKSTLIDLLLRLYDVTAGVITFDGVDIKSLPVGTLRRNFAVVSQSDALFHRSIRDNIAFAAERTDDEQIVSAARMADAHAFIESLNLENGYDTIVGDRGAKLSGGQQQRILLARAFLRRRPVLILDEATSALDSKSESVVQDAIASYSREATVIAIAHRLSTVRGFDKIVLLEAGRVSAIGSHESLLESSTLYRELWDRQVAGSD